MLFRVEIHSLLQIINIHGKVPVGVLAGLVLLVDLLRELVLIFLFLELFLNQTLLRIVLVKRLFDGIDNHVAAIDPEGVLSYLLNQLLLNFDKLVNYDSEEEVHQSEKDDDLIQNQIDPPD